MRAPDSAGQLVGGRYRLEVRITGPGPAAGWCAVDELLGRTVVLRRLPAGVSLAGEPLAAVRAAARLTDSRVARIFDADDAGECPYLVCERVPGEHLDDLILTAGLPGPDLAALIVAEAADVLAGAHEAGAPHLHLTPRSLLWGRDGLRITGLGIEEALHRAVTAAPAGPPGEPLPAADARALGEVLYAMLTGYWPGQRPSALPAAPRLRGMPYAPRQVRPGVPGAMNAVTCRALGLPRHPEPPFRGPAELADALRQPARSWPVSARLPAVPRPSALARRPVFGRAA